MKKTRYWPGFVLVDSFAPTGPLWFDAVVRIYVDDEEPLNFTLLELVRPHMPASLLKLCYTEFIYGYSVSPTRIHTLSCPHQANIGNPTNILPAPPTPPNYTEYYLGGECHTWLCAASPLTLLWWCRWCFHSDRRCQCWCVLGSMLVLVSVALLLVVVCISVVMSTLPGPMSWFAPCSNGRVLHPDMCQAKAEMLSPHQYRLQTGQRGTANLLLTPRLGASANNNLSMCHSSNSPNVH